MATISRTDWLRMVAAMGPAEAEAWRRQQGIDVEGDDAGMGTAMPPPGDEPPAGALGMPDDEDFSPATIYRQMQQLQRDTMSSEEAQRKQRRQMFEQARATLEQQRMGPSRAEQLFALSAAFAQPQRYKGFGGMMANVAPALADMAGSRREADARRADAMLRLQQQYLSGEMEGERSSLNARRALLTAAAPMAKPQKPRLGMDPLGRGVVNMDDATITPFGSAGLPKPQSKAEYDALPQGAQYLDPSGTLRRKGGGPTQSASGGFSR